MPRRGVIIVSSSIDFSTKVKSLLMKNDFEVMDCCKTGNEAIKKSFEYYPDVVIIHDKLSDMTAFSAADIISSQIPVVVLTHLSNISRIDDQDNIYAVTLPVKPLILINTISLAVKFGLQIASVKNKSSVVDKTAEERKIVNKAKEFLQDNYDFTEQKAYRTLQKLSMDKRTKISDVAATVLRNGRL